MNQIEKVDHLGSLFRKYFPNSYSSISFEANFFRSGDSENKWRLFILISEDQDLNTTKVNEQFKSLDDLQQRLEFFFRTADAYKPDPDGIEQEAKT